MTEDETIRKLWRDPSFSGAFSGISNFQSALDLEKGITVSRNKLIGIMKEDPNFLLEMHKIKKRIKRRPMVVHGYCILWQADLAQLFDFGGYQYALVCCDVFSRRIFARPLKSKAAKNVQEAFEEIFVEAKGTPEKLETDQGVYFIISGPGIICNVNFFTYFRH